jgi:hypothetical protein
MIDRRRFLLTSLVGALATLAAETFSGSCQASIS